jgi:hypothetical protein
MFGFASPPLLALPTSLERNESYYFLVDDSDLEEQRNNSSGRAQMAAPKLFFA